MNNYWDDGCCTIILKSGYVKNLVIRTRVGHDKNLEFDLIAWRENDVYLEFRKNSRIRYT